MIKKTATAKDLRNKTAALLSEVRRGREIIVTYRGKSIAVLAPIERVERSGLSGAGFGMWKDRRDLRSVERWLKKLRTPRYGR